MLPGVSVCAEKLFYYNVFLFVVHLWFEHLFCARCHQRTDSLPGHPEDQRRCPRD